MSSRPDPAPAPAPPTPERIGEILWGACAARALASAAELDLFTKIAEGKTSLPELEEATGCAPRGLRPLLDAMVALGLVQREGSGREARHALAPDAAAFLVRGRPAWMGDFLRFHAEHVVPNWHGLSACVRTGRPVVAADDPPEGLAFWEVLVDALFQTNRAAALLAGREIARRHRDPVVRVLDVAAGSGVWGLSAAEVDPRVHVVALDLPEIVKHVDAHAERLGLEGRVSTLAGHLREADLGEARFEAAILGHILHSEGPVWSRRLLERVARALVPGGTIVIAEFVPDPDRAGPLVPVLFSLNMLVLSSEGDAFTMDQLRAWLGEAGFGAVETLQAPAPSPLVLATRRA